MSRKENGERGDIYARITERIVADLEKGVRLWIQPWNAANATGRITRPLPHTGEPYSGMNVLLLWSEAMARGFASPTWMTFKQAVELGGHVRKGESGSIVIYASRFTKIETDAHGGEVARDIPFLKAYVFNVDQIEGLPENFYLPPPVLDPMARIEHADRFCAYRRRDPPRWLGGILFAVDRPHPDAAVRDVSRCGFVCGGPQPWVHWTADPRRVGRDLSRYARDRSERAREELVVEIGSALLCADLGIVPELEPSGYVIALCRSPALFVDLCRDKVGFGGISRDRGGPPDNEEGDR
jgi:antirestriction protein ArdC